MENIFYGTCVMIMVAFTVMLWFAMLHFWNKMATICSYTILGVGIIMFLGMVVSWLI